MELPPYPAKRIVRPKQPKGAWRPIIALSHGVLLLERGAEYEATSLPALIRNEPSSILVSQDFGPHLARIVAHYEQPGNDPGERFNYRVTPRYRNDRERDTGTACDAVINFVGFRKLKEDERIPGMPHAERDSRYHYPLEPIHLVQSQIDDLRPDNLTDPSAPYESRLDKLMLWAQEVRDWCCSHGLNLTPSSGGIVAQLLCHPMFYPEPRRKVPRIVNDAARSRLPGNYYQLHAPTKQPHRAYYLDISAAHHQIARSIRFPDANSLHYYGRHDRATPDNTVTTERPRRFYAPPDDKLLDQYGLFHLSLSVPHIRERSFPPPWGQRAGIVDAWVFSNELSLLKEHHIKVNGIYAALVSHETEPGLNLYSRWCLEQLQEHTKLKPWLKPVLHSTYGVLAARPIPFETGFYRANGGTEREYHLGATSVRATARRSKAPVESRLANVVHRGMIEAGVRKEALWMARYLTEVERCHVLAVYADSLFVLDKGVDLPILPPMWRVSDHCSNLTFYDSTHFTSDELTRMPGMSRDRRDVARLIARLEREALLQSAHKPSRAEARRKQVQHAAGQEQARRRSQGADAKGDQGARAAGQGRSRSRGL